MLYGDGKFSHWKATTRHTWCFSSAGVSGCSAAVRSACLLLVLAAADIMDEQSRMMHPVTSQVGMMPQGYGMQPVDPNHGGPTTPDQETRKQDIGEILQQIMNITDQSLDEAQAR